MNRTFELEIMLERLLVAEHSCFESEFSDEAKAALVEAHENALLVLTMAPCCCERYEFPHRRSKECYFNG